MPKKIRPIITCFIVLLLASCESYFTWTLPNSFLRVITEQPENISSRGVNLYGLIENINDSTVLGDIGFVFSKDPDVSLIDDDYVLATGSPEFAAVLTGLIPETKYYFRAYVEDNGSTYYGKEVSFTTNEAKLNLISTNNCNSLNGVNSSLSQPGPGPDEWEISSNGYLGSCWYAGGANGINWVQFQANFTHEGVIRFWIQTFNPGYSNKNPTIYVDGSSIGEAEQIAGDQSSWDFMQVESALINPGNHTIKIEINTGSVYNDISIDEIEFFEYD